MNTAKAANSSVESSHKAIETTAMQMNQAATRQKKGN